MTRRLGELLVAEGRISQAVLARALELQNTQARGLRLGAILLRWGLIPENALLEALSTHQSCPAVAWSTLSAASKQAVNLLSPAQAARLGAVPYAADRKTVRVAFANPSNLAAIDEVQAITGKRVLPSVTTQVRLLQAQQLFYRLPIARDIWIIVQKIERPVPESPTLTQAPIVATLPPPADPRSLWIEGEAQGEEISSAADEETEAGLSATEEGEQVSREPGEAGEAEQAAVIEDLVEAAPAADAELGAEAGEAQSATADNERADQTVPVIASRGGDSFSFQSLLTADRLDPFSDDTPLAEFIEQALSFYEAHPSFKSALAALDDGSIENLDSPMEERPPRALNLDETLPSPRRRRDSDVQLTL